MLSGILNSEKAISVNIAIMRAFVLVRQYAMTYKDLTERLKEIESKFKVDMFNRQSLAFIVKEKIELVPLSQLSYAFENKFLGFVVALIKIQSAGKRLISVCQNILPATADFFRFTF